MLPCVYAFSFSCITTSLLTSQAWDLKILHVEICYVTNVPSMREDFTH